MSFCSELSQCREALECYSDICFVSLDFVNSLWHVYLKMSIIRFCLRVFEFTLLGYSEG